MSPKPEKDETPKSPFQNESEWIMNLKKMSELWSRGLIPAHMIQSWERIYGISPIKQMKRDIWFSRVETTAVIIGIVGMVLGFIMIDFLKVKNEFVIILTLFSLTLFLCMGSAKGCREDESFLFRRCLCQASSLLKVSIGSLCTVDQKGAADAMLFSKAALIKSLQANPVTAGWEKIDVLRADFRKTHDIFWHLGIVEKEWTRFFR